MATGSAAAAAQVGEPGPVRVIDDFEDVGAWEATASDQVDAALRQVDTPDGRALCLDYDFNGVSGHAAIRRRLPLDYPDNYAFSFRMRGQAPVNDLQFKLIDDSGDNVWWVNRPETQVPTEWTDVRYKKRHIDFAWGPREDRSLRESAQVEFTVYASQGGRGEVCFDQLALQTLPVPPEVPPAPVFEASSSAEGSAAADAGDHDTATAWTSAAGGEQTLTLDLGYLRELGGLTLRWREGLHAGDYDVELSDDGSQWREARRVRTGDGGSDWLQLPEAEARYVRLAMHAGPGAAYALEDVAVRDIAFGASRNAMIADMAKSMPRGLFPRGFYDEQSYWTLVGIDGGPQQGLMSEDGALEIERGGITVEPFLLDAERRLVTWADVEPVQTLARGYMPIPSVRWTHDGVNLTTTAFATGERDESRMLARYTLENATGEARTLTLALAVRPFQVNHPVQFLTTPGGASPLTALAWDGVAVRAEGRPRIVPLQQPDGFFATAFDAGMAIGHLADIPRPTAQQVNDETGLASGVMFYRVRLEPYATRTFGLDIPLSGQPLPLDAGDDVAGFLGLEQARVEDQWKQKLDRVAVHLPREQQRIADTLRTALAHILINRDGPMIRPGTRSYARSWIRDGAMTSEGLVRMGHVDAAREFLEWYAPYQFDNGKVPCCVDVRGSDPVVENDSQGELIHLISEVWRYGRDRDLLERMWPHVEAATRYMDQLRASERTEANLEPGRRPQYGLMPPSISHEGYSAKPAYSYWDDFWALKGYKDAARMAATLGTDDAQWMAASRDAFRADLYDSIRAAAELHDIGYIPGAADLGDFDATSTTIALSPGGEAAALPRELLLGTFRRYWDEFVARREGEKDWEAYTPYELRNVAAFVRLGWRHRAQELLDYFFADRRPGAWNQWAEVVSREYREPRFIGDMPHGWVASDYIRSALDLFAYERDADASLVVADGIPAAWLEGDGIAINRLRTPFGEFSYALRRADGRTLLDIPGGIELPEGGIVLRWPDATLPGATTINGEPAGWNGDELRIRKLPAQVVIENARTE
ncbi:discoidin domain-containing protein [Coralloluteibacterium stylophorae]|uniref:Discoidin domain-containing protein n=2 Tax=Coralloluteibacterium stylophorae TaxID=1776034 RepID=A0AAP2C961_9GAMM|nr:discoidin domain-containing protein [Coralloluteibacterium stylophorae]MBS7456155.1 discoidin domain-containing protein [Coralloluteibacterium stylophorae]